VININYSISPELPIYCFIA